MIGILRARDIEALQGIQVILKNLRQPLLVDKDLAPL